MEEISGYETDEEEFSRYASGSGDADSVSISSESEVEDPLINLDQAEGAAISRKRSFQPRTAFAKCSQGGSKRTRTAHGLSTNVHVSAQQRVTEFPGETNCGQLYCQACSQVLSKKKSIVVLWSTTCRRSTTKRKGHPGQRKLSDKRISLRVFRLTTNAGIPLAKLNIIRPLLERNNHRLTEATHLAQYVPFVLETEKERIREEVSEAEFVSVLFDGSTRQGEALAVIVRFVDKEFEIQQLLVRLNVLAKSLNAQQLAREIIIALSNDLRLPMEKVIAAIRDGASVNTAAMQHVSTIMYPMMTDIV